MWKNIVILSAAVLTLTYVGEAAFVHPLASVRLEQRRLGELRIGFSAPELIYKESAGAGNEDEVFAEPVSDRIERENRARMVLNRQA